MPTLPPPGAVMAALRVVAHQLAAFDHQARLFGILRAQEVAAVVAVVSRQRLAGRIGAQTLQRRAEATADLGDAGAQRGAAEAIVRAGLSSRRSLAGRVARSGSADCAGPVAEAVSAGVSLPLPAAPACRGPHCRRRAKGATDQQSGGASSVRFPARRWLHANPSGVQALHCHRGFIASFRLGEHRSGRPFHATAQDRSRPNRAAGPPRAAGHAPAPAADATASVPSPT